MPVRIGVVDATWPLLAALLALGFVAGVVLASRRARTMPASMALLLCGFAGGLTIAAGLAVAATSGRPFIPSGASSAVITVGARRTPVGGPALTRLVAAFDRLPHARTAVVPCDRPVRRPERVVFRYPGRSPLTVRLNGCTWVAPAATPRRDVFDPAASTAALAGRL